LLGTVAPVEVWAGPAGSSRREESQARSLPDATPAEMLRESESEIERQRDREREKSEREGERYIYVYVCKER